VSQDVGSGYVAVQLEKRTAKNQETATQLIVVHFMEFGYIHGLGFTMSAGRFTSEKLSRLFELTSMLVRLDHVGR
jgi:hypothetical protein